MVVCVNYDIETFHREWKEQRQQEEKSASRGEFQKLADAIRKGFKWNLHLLKDDDVDGVETSQRVVDFYDVHTIPRLFLERFNEARGVPRLRLEPPYREHLSQSFARFFMRVACQPTLRRFGYLRPQRPSNAPCLTSQANERNRRRLTGGTACSTTTPIPLVTDRTSATRTP